MNDCLYLILNAVSTNAVWGCNALPCTEPSDPAERPRTQGRRTRLRRYAACVLCPLRQGAGDASPVLPDRRSVGVQGTRSFAKGL